MFCRSCGSPVDKDSVFCNVCGAPQDAGNAAVKPPKKSKKPLIITLVAVLGAALIAGVIILILLFKGTSSTAKIWVLSDEIKAMELIALDVLILSAKTDMYILAGHHDFHTPLKATVL